MKHTFPLIIFGVLFSSMSLAQTGGDNFAALNQNFDARSIAVGGNAMLAWDNDVSKTIWNPALLNKEMDQRVGIDYTSFPASISFAQIYYSKYNKKWDMMQSFALQQAHYGTMTRTNEFGVIDGEFSPQDLILSSAISKKLNEQFQIGFQAKWILSGIDGYSANGFYTDFSSVFTSKNKTFLASLLVRNAGFIISNFSNTANTRSPLEIQLSFSKKPEHMPVRFLFNIEQIQDPILTYTNDPKLVEVNSLENTTTINRPSFSQKLLRHMSLGAELVVSKNFHVRLGYDYGRRQELSLKDFEKSTGISWGFSLRVSKFNIQYGRSAYHVAGPISSISIGCNLSSFKSKTI